MPDSIEAIILQGEQRGVSALRRHLPDAYCDDAARLALETPGPVLIGTGFYILTGQTAETDGPPGAIALGRAFAKLGRDVVYVTDAYGMGVVRAAAGEAARVEEFPIADVDASDNAARLLLSRVRPGLAIAIERCGPSADGVYRNMRGMDITRFTGRIDRLVAMHPATIGIGDGGNEIGMGSLARAIAVADKLPDLPAVTQTSRVVVAGVSNWGAWGLLAAMSLRVGRDLLPAPGEEWEWVERCVEAGAVDGFSGERVAKVDGMGKEDYQRPLVALGAHLRQRLG